ncbi:ABC transporter ATP-binding protein [Sneathiella marina]|uniref:ABC transporter ATP-binding protein n=1 Tax=Sneathiella marina TaxID=2950108 RepID=A0ABY4W483_9PROT|nr:ABC transporter ATP-binding protein [Sneathiella marina]USG62001.1 ABC transporter ATP-binding protein [Sneathiella marina]
MLSIQNLSLSYGQHIAIEQISIDIRQGETVAILGANGAGKTSLLKAIAGLETVSENSELTFEGQNLRYMPAYRRVDIGLSLVPEGRGLFPDLSVEENLQLGANPKRARTSESKNREFVYDLFPKLAFRSKQLVGTMSGGEQQMVAVGRSIMSEPKLLMLDEPSLGLAPIVIRELFEALKKIRVAGMTMLIVEQNVKASLAISDRGYVMGTGSIVGQGTANELTDNEDLHRAYMGAAK